MVRTKYNKDKLTITQVYEYFDKTNIHTLEVCEAVAYVCHSLLTKDKDSIYSLNLEFGLRREYFYDCTWVILNAAIKFLEREKIIYLEKDFGRKIVGKRGAPADFIRLVDNQDKHLQVRDFALFWAKLSKDSIRYRSVRLIKKDDPN